jgi:hypothetical protein
MSEADSCKVEACMTIACCTCSSFLSQFTPATQKTVKQIRSATSQTKNPFN